ncbi:MAG: acyl-CoA dehydrogenase family protein [Actinomycetota bacterium]|nr:acyl-CoA dehydrogenase family protein [Actinomycetota bacterium]
MPDQDPTAFRDSVRRFLARHGRRKEEAGPWALGFVTDHEEAGRRFEEERAWQATRFRAGMAGFTYPTRYGGQGGLAWQDEIFQEEARPYGPSSTFIAGTIAMLGPTLMALGTEEQKAGLIARLLSAEDVWCQLFSEPGAGSDLASLACRAVRDGDDFVVSGQKVWNSAAQWADHGFILVRTDPEAPKHRGITMLLIDMRWPGVTVRPLIQASGAADFAEVFLDEVRVPATNVVGEVDAGWSAARIVLANEAAMIGGGGRQTYPPLLRLADLHGRRSDVHLRARLSDLYVRDRLLDLMSGRIMEAVRRREAPPVDPAILELYYAENRRRAGDLAASIAGAAAMLSDDEPSRWVESEIMRRYTVSIGGGTTEVLRNNLAERALGLPREPGDERTRPWSQLRRN